MKKICPYLPSIIGIIIVIMFFILQYESINYYKQCEIELEKTNVWCADFISPSSILFGALLLISTCFLQWICYLLNKTKKLLYWSIIYSTVIILSLCI